MVIPPKERSAWLAEQIENSRKLRNETALPNE
jgi:hypothetical protein